VWLGPAPNAAIVQISSTDNPLYKRLRRLATVPRASRQTRRALAEGIHLVESALAAGVRVHTIAVRASGAAEPAQRLAAQAQHATDAPLVTLSPALFDAIAPVENGVGLLIEIEAAAPPLPQAMSADAVWLDGIQDPGNVGAVLRTAAAAGVRHVAAGEGTAALWSPKVVRAAMGAHFVLSLYEGVSAERVRQAFQSRVLAADTDAADSVYDEGWGNEPTLWLFGAEGAGLSAAALAIADQRLRIPIEAGVESLNVATAAAVCLFEQRRRRMCIARLE